MMCARRTSRTVRYGRWSFYKFATLVYQNLDHPTAVHTSGLLVAPGWPEYRFNAVRAAFGGSFTTQPAGVSLRLTTAGHPQPGLEEVTNNLFKGVAQNSRQFSIGHDIFSSLEAYEQVGNAKAIFELVRDYKKGSLAMDAAQRQFMTDAALFREPRRNLKDVARARWMAEGNVYRKWTNAGTSVRISQASSQRFGLLSIASPHIMTRTVAPRFCAVSGV